MRFGAEDTEKASPPARPAETTVTCGADGENRHSRRKQGQSPVFVVLYAEKVMLK
jgi:hypothetical protein